MKYLIFSALLFFFINCTALEKSELISPIILKKEIDSKKNITLIDCTEPDEFNEAHIKGAKNIPIRQLKEKLPIVIPNLKKDQSIVIYCYSGVRSAQGVKKLKEMGYKNVKSLDGGIQNWQNNNLPTE